MFKCTVCEKVYNSKVDYCDCGNDIFEEIFAGGEDLTKFTLTGQQIISGAIFAVCVGLSGWIWFGIDASEKNIPTVPATTQKVEEFTNIPSIDKIWDNTPASDVSKSPYAVYKSELQKALYSHLAEKEIIDEGRCQIEFKVTKNGTLTNRRIYKEKGGSQFNNLVLKMVKNTTTVSAPPAGYSGAKLRAEVYTENGVIKIVMK